MNVVEVSSGDCDACPAEAHVAAYIFARMPSGNSLGMCIHHGREHHEALVSQGATIVDLSHALHEQT